MATGLGIYNNLHSLKTELFEINDTLDRIECDKFYKVEKLLKERRRIVLSEITTYEGITYKEVKNIG